MEDKLKNKVVDFVNNPYDLHTNIDLGYLYENSNQLASALSHYLRGAEFGLDNIIENKRVSIVECLLRASICIDKLGSRNHSTKSLLLNALSYLPTLPQLYLQMSKVYETTNEWNECNSMCSIGIEFINNYERLKYDTRTKDEILNELLYQKAISNYYIGKTKKARIDLVSLRKKKNLQSWIVAAIDKSLDSIGYPTRFSQINYDSIPSISKKELFKDKNFVSYSQCLQDIFVSTLIDKMNGTYVEIGSHDPIINNNTYLLETKYLWNGISLDIDEGIVNKFNSTRKNKAIIADGVTVDYKKLFKDNNLPNEIDYLQIDCDPAIISFEVLKNIPFDEYKFAIITFEHDYYKGDISIRDKSREVLEKEGYQLLISDVAHDCLNSFEDWWIHPKLISKYISEEKLNSIKNIDKEPKCVIDIFL